MRVCVCACVYVCVYLHAIVTGRRSRLVKLCDCVLFSVYTCNQARASETTTQAVSSAHAAPRYVHVCARAACVHVCMCMCMCVYLLLKQSIALRQRLLDCVSACDRPHAFYDSTDERQSERVTWLAILSFRVFIGLY